MKNYTYASTYPMAKVDIIVPANAYAIIAPKFLKKCLYNITSVEMKNRSHI